IAAKRKLQLCQLWKASFGTLSVCWSVVNLKQPNDQAFIPHRIDFVKLWFLPDVVVDSFCIQFVRSQPKNRVITFPPTERRKEILIFPIGTGTALFHTLPGIIFPRRCCTTNCTHSKNPNLPKGVVEDSAVITCRTNLATFLPMHSVNAGPYKPAIIHQQFSYVTFSDIHVHLEPLGWIFGFMIEPN